MKFRVKSTIILLIYSLVFINTYKFLQVFAQEETKKSESKLPLTRTAPIAKEESQSSVTIAPFPEEANKTKKITTSGEYTISVEDQMEVFVWQNPDLSRDITVGPDGKISYPLVGRIQAAGLTIEQLEEKIREALSNYIKYPHVSIMIKKFAVDKIIILGAIKNPGVYTYKGAINLIEAIALAGDFTENAREDNVMIVRGNLTEQPEVTRINLHDMQMNIALRPGDIVYIPRKDVISDKVIILGAVGYPGVYTYKGVINLFEAIALSGDFAENAKKDSVMIVRNYLTEQPEVMRINTQHIIKGEASKTSLVLMPNDVIYVPTSFIYNFNKFLKNIRPTIDNATAMFDFRKEILRLHFWRDEELKAGY